MTSIDDKLNLLRKNVREYPSSRGPNASYRSGPYDHYGSFFTGRRQSARIKQSQERIETLAPISKKVRAVVAVF